MINDERYDFLITPHKQTVGYNKSKRKSRKKTIIAKQKHIIKRKLSKTRNAVSESDTIAIQNLQDLNNSIEKIKPIDQRKRFFDSESISPSTTKDKRINTKSCLNKPLRLCNWNQPIRHIENYTFTVLRYKNDAIRGQFRR